MVLHRFLRSVVRHYPVVVFGIYVVLLFSALAMMFIFPPGTILLLWIGLVGLVGVVIAAKVLGVVLALSARRLLNRGGCPRCGTRMDTMRDPAERWQCASCGAVFGPKGREILLPGEEGLVGG
ncbi:MAG: hypothetical protein HKO59_06795 [Phycisphaerales bacterium]|nr:hypothetical protein [Phycisphaerae bacterium]NNF43773.1 hypothetical protein [Phycisphaerales bacterium]NNM25683.1 hypothetical protein [Phycisphaerales bacterium]